MPRLQTRACGICHLRQRLAHVESANQGDIYGLAVNELCKTEQAAKPHVQPGTIVATRAVHEVAGATLYPKHCKFTPLKGTGSRGRPNPLFTIDIKADISFMISQQRKADQGSA